MNLEVPQLKVFEGRVVHGFSSKRDGNMDFRFGEREQVIQNRQLFLEKIGIRLEELVWMNPVHGAGIETVTPADFGFGAFAPKCESLVVDALITSKKDVKINKTPALTLGPADCAPIVITDKNAEYLSLIHAGRKSTELEIATKTVIALANQGVYPDQLLVGIGPSICSACYQMPYLETVSPGAWWNYLSVDPNTAKVDFAVNRAGSLRLSPEGRLLFRVSPDDPNQMIGIDVAAFNKDQLMSVGVPAGNIEIMNFCTAEQGRKGKIFSHHLTNEDKEKYPEGRFMAVAQLAA
jgi:copper oxidase (laccase) domain-containing protein